MAKKNVKFSNARHKVLENKNRSKMFAAYDSGDSKWEDFNHKMAYHRSVIQSQTNVGRVLTPKERKHVYTSVKDSNGRAILYVPPK